MSSHPKGMPPREDGLQIDISKTDTIKCENCGNRNLSYRHFLKENICTLCHQQVKKR